ncbi:MAG: hypothetical protein AB2693_28415 [Candidatus Thiodiazotropha sp.]
MVDGQQPCHYGLSLLIPLFQAQQTGRVQSRNLSERAVAHQYFEKGLPVFRDRSALFLQPNKQDFLAF